MIRIVRLADLKPGMIIGQDLFNNAGQMLMAENTVLTPDLIARFDKWGTSFVPIKFADEVVTAVIPGRLTHEQAAGVNAFLAEGVAYKRQALAITYEILDNLRNRKAIDRDTTRGVIIKLVQKASTDRDLLINMLTVRRIDNYIFNHSLNVCILAILVGHMMKLTAKQLILLGEAALLHDVGMTVIPEDVVQRQGPLTEEERFQIQKHPRMSAELIQKMTNTETELLKAVLHHHEREDGSGYPDGLQGEEISPFGKILAVVDVYDAMTNSRSYRSSHPPYQTVKNLLTQVSSGLSQPVVQAFVAEMSLHPTGSMVRLNTGALGIVVRANRQAPIRPLLRMIRDAQGKLYPEEVLVDLMVDRQSFITEGIFDRMLIDELMADDARRSGIAATPSA